MREKLQQLMNAEQLTGSKLAEFLGIQPSSISHIMGGRNKPSLDFVQKILQRYPRINPDWLLLDSDEMYRPQTSPAPAVKTNPQLPFVEEENPTLAATTNNEVSVANSNTESPSLQTISSNDDTDAMTQVGIIGSSQHGGIKRVIVLYEDRTFESYEPKR